MPGPGRPPSPPLDLDAAKIAELVAQSHEFAKDKGKLKAWLAPKRIFHVLFQDHLSTLSIPGGKGVVLNAQSSKLFLEMSEPLAAALEGVEDEDPESEDPVPDGSMAVIGDQVYIKESHAKPPSERRVDVPAQRKRRVKRRKSPRPHSR